jgi:hypothetical protein
MLSASCCRTWQAGDDPGFGLPTVAWHPSMTLLTETVMTCRPTSTALMGSVAKVQTCAGSCVGRAPCPPNSSRRGTVGRQVAGHSPARLAPALWPPRQHRYSDPRFASLHTGGIREVSRHGEGLNDLVRSWQLRAGRRPRGARNGSQRCHLPPDSVRPTQNVRPGQGLPVRLGPTVTDTPNRPGLP